MKKRKKEEDQDIKDNEMFLDRALEIIDDNAKLNESSFLHSLSYDYIFDFDFYQNLINSLMCLQSNLEMDLGENKKNILKNLFLINRITLILGASHFNKMDRYKIKKAKKSDYWKYLKELDDVIFILHSKILTLI